jgi:hypothetical protein
VDTVARETLAIKKLSDSSQDFILSAESRFQPFVEQGQSNMAVLQESIGSLGKNLQSTGLLYGESISISGATETGDSAQKFFATISEVVSLFKKVNDEVKQWLLEEEKAKQQAAKAREADSNSKNGHLSDVEEDIVEVKSDVDTHQNLFDRFKNQQEASADDIISQLKAKMKLRRKVEDE